MNKEFSVTEISNKIKEILESNLNCIRIRGEISGFKLASSGHAYFNLKDSLAILNCTCWRPTMAKIPFQLSDGVEVIATGKLTSYAGQSRYQLSVERLEQAGVGAMMQILKERKEKLAREGLFDKSHKIPIPYMPDRIGVITSITGAVIQDIIHRITYRSPTRLIIWPVSVQGETAATEISGAIDGFNKMDDATRPNLLIVARGGGSIEDLWPFNEEVVVRSVSGSNIPVISAVGHETDYTLIDFVADMRAPTPTAAAEFAVPVAADLKYTINLYHSKLMNKVNNLINFKHQTVSNLNNIFKFQLGYINLCEQKLDIQNFKLSESLPKFLQIKMNILSQFSSGRFKPNKILDYKKLEIKYSIDSLNKVVSKSFEGIFNKFNLCNLMLNSLDYNNVLKRGFSLIITDHGKYVKSANEAYKHDKFSIRFSDGAVKVKKL